jgi:hypothetical protein
MRWTGAHTGLVCLACPAWSVSPGAETRAGEHLAAIDKSAARRTAPLADPEAERLAAETFAAERAELLDGLDGLADALDVSDFPRGDAEYAPARRAGIRYGGTAALYADRARKADTLDQLRRDAADAAQFAASIGPWLGRIADLRGDLDQEVPDGDVIEGEAIGDGQEPRPELTPDERRAAWQRMIGQARQPALQSAGLSGQLAPAHAAYVACEWCRAGQRRIGGRWPAAVASIEAPDMAPAPAWVCADHLAEARQRHGAALHVHHQGRDQFWAAHRAAVEQAMARDPRVTVPLIGTDGVVRYVRPA